MKGIQQLFNMETPTNTQILEAAKTSPEAKKALMKLFPYLFEDEKYFDLGLLRVEKSGYDYQLFTEESTKKCITTYNHIVHNLLSIRTGGKFAYKSFFLNKLLSWKIINDEAGEVYLIPTRRTLL